VSDDYLESVTLTEGIHAYDVTGRASYTINNLANGEHTFTLKAIDKVGHEATDTLTITVDLPIAVRITSPTNYTQTNKSIEVTWEITGGEPTSVKLSYYQNGTMKEYDVTGESSFLVPVLIPEGMYLITITVKDASGTVDHDYIYVTFDLTPPSLTIDAPANGSWRNSSRISVEWSVDSGATVTMKVDGAEKGVVQSPFAIEWLGDGQHVIELTATDAAGNSMTRSVTVNVDTSPPNVRFISPQDGIWANSSIVALEWAASSDSKSYWFRMGDEAWQAVVGNSRTVQVPSDGQFVFHVRVLDTAGNAAEASITVNVDTEPPQLAITSPRNGSYADANVVAITYSASPDAQDVLIYVDGALLDGSEAQLEEGEHVIRLVARDRAGNEAVTSARFTVDTTLKAIALDLGSLDNDDGMLTNKRKVHVSWEPDNVTKALVALDGGDEVDVTGQSGHMFADLKDGDHIVTVRLYDSSDKETVFTVRITVDTAAPSWTLLEPGDGARTTATSITLRWECDQDAVAIEIQLDGGDWVKVDASLGERSFDNLAMGTHTVNVRAVDAAGNFDQKAVSFVVQRSESALAKPVNWIFIIWALLLACTIAAMVISRHGWPAPTTACGPAPPPAPAPEPPQVQAAPSRMDDVAAVDVVDELFEDILSTDFLEGFDD